MNIENFAPQMLLFAASCTLLLEIIMASHDKQLVKDNFLNPLDDHHSDPPQLHFGLFCFSPHCGRTFFYDEICIGQDGTIHKDFQTIKLLTEISCIFDTCDNSGNTPGNMENDNCPSFSKSTSSKSSVSIRMRLLKQIYPIASSLEWFQYYALLLEWDEYDRIKLTNKNECNGGNLVNPVMQTGKLSRADAVDAAKTFSKAIHAWIYEWFIKNRVLFLKKQPNIHISKIDLTSSVQNDSIRNVIDNISAVYMYMFFVLFFNNDLKDSQMYFLSGINNSFDVCDLNNISNLQNLLDSCVENQLSNFIITAEYIRNKCTENDSRSIFPEFVNFCEHLLPQLEKYKHVIPFLFVLDCKTVFDDLEMFIKNYKSLVDEYESTSLEQQCTNDIDAKFVNIKFMEKQAQLILEMLKKFSKAMDLVSWENKMQNDLVANMMMRGLNILEHVIFYAQKKLIIPDFIYAQGYVLYLAKKIRNAPAGKLKLYVKFFYSNNSILTKRIIYLTSGIISLPVLLKTLGDRILSDENSELEKPIQNEEQAVETLLMRCANPNAVIDFYVSMRVNNLSVDKLMLIFTARLKAEIILSIPQKTYTIQIIKFKVAFFAWAILRQQKQGWANLYSDKNFQVLWNKYLLDFKDEFILYKDLVN